MRVRTLLISTAIVSSILGAVVVYLVLSVPNDLKAGALLKEARQELAAGRADQARSGLSRVVQQYPRTDAAAAAVVALVTIAEEERKKLEGEIGELRSEAQRQTRAIADLQKSVEAIRNAPPKVIVQAPPKPAPRPAARRPTTRSRRR